MKTTEFGLIKNMVSPFEKNSAAHPSLFLTYHVRLHDSRKDRGRAVPASKGGQSNFYSINHWNEGTENEKSFHTATKHLILHCLNNGHSGENKS